MEQREGFVYPLERMSKSENQCSLKMLWPGPFRGGGGQPAHNCESGTLVQHSVLWQLFAIQFKPGRSPAYV
jgi:hypothetical protein